MYHSFSLSPISKLLPSPSSGLTQPGNLQWGKGRECGWLPPSSIFLFYPSSPTHCTASNPASRVEAQGRTRRKDLNKLSFTGSILTWHWSVSQMSKSDTFSRGLLGTPLSLEISHLQFPWPGQHLLWLALRLSRTLWGLPRYKSPSVSCISHL